MTGAGDSKGEVGASGTAAEKSLPVTAAPSEKIGSTRTPPQAPWALIGAGWVGAIVLCVALQATGRELLAKSILAAVMVSVAVAALYLVRVAGRTVAELKIVDSGLKEARDQVVLSGMFARAELSNLRERIKRNPDEEHAQTISTIVKSVPTLISMFMAKEKNLMKWGMAGFKLANSIYKYFNSK